LEGRTRAHETASEEAASCGGELTAYAERVYARRCGRQSVLILVGSMDWRR
jgi:hypothetical protein